MMATRSLHRFISFYRTQKKATRECPLQFSERITQLQPYL